MLHGGVANAGAVTRQGDHVLRPSNAHTETIHRFLRHLDSVGFEGASVPVAVDDDGRERLHFVAGDVPLVPYPHWAQADEALASIAVLMRRFHEASASFQPDPADTWSDEMADPAGGSLICHNDVCLENVVFRDGEAVAFLDFDFAAPGRPVHDVAAMARMCVPVDDDSRERFGWRPCDGPGDLPQRLREVADAYGLDADERPQLVAFLGESMARGGRFLQRRVEAGDPNFTRMWEENGGMARFDRRRAWWDVVRPSFEAALR